MALSLKNLFSRKPNARAAREDQMRATVTAEGAAVGGRPLKNPAWASSYTPERVSRILDAAEQGDEHAVSEYFALVDKVIEREMHAAGVLNGLVLAIAGLPHRVLPRAGDSTRRGQRLADEVAQLLQPGSPLRLAAPALISQGITHGIGPASIIWDTSRAPWVPVDLVQKPAHFFTFDRRDGRTVLLRAETSGQPARPIEPGTALIFTPRRTSGLQIKNGLGWILCWAYVIKSIVLADELVFIETFGMPLTKGVYPRNASPADVSLLRRAVENIGTSFRGVFREDLKVEFESIARSSTDIYERLLRYFDELISKVVWASTLTTDAGSGAGSYALGKVHAEGKYDVVRSYAHQWAACLQDLVDAYVAWNYGADTSAPRVVVEVEEPEDLVANSQVVRNLADAGVPLSAQEVRERFGFREPQKGEEVIGGGSMLRGLLEGAPNRRTLDAAKTAEGCPVHAPNAAGLSAARDAIDDLADSLNGDWEVVNASIDAAIEETLNGASTLDNMRERLAHLVQTMDVADLQLLLTKARTKTRLAGDTDTEV